MHAYIHAYVVSKLAARSLERGEGTCTVCTRGDREVLGEGRQEEICDVSTHAKWKLDGTQAANAHSDPKL